MTLAFWARALVGLYALSGLTSLAYEILWVRMLSLQFGVSIFGVVAGVTAFMAGLGVGSLWGARFSHKVSRPLLIFALLEAFVAVYALTSPLLLQISDTWLDHVAPEFGIWSWYALQGLGALLLLLIPALAMGAAFAFMLKALAPSTIPLSKIYGFNACGGAIGALLPLWLLPTLGWPHAMLLIASLGLAIAVSGILLARFHWASGDASNAPTKITRPAGLNVLAYAGVGAGALMLEVAWTRLFGMLLLRTEYVLAVLLAVFVAGIGLGSLLATQAIRRNQTSLWLTILPFATSGFALLSLWCLPLVSTWAEASDFDSLATAISAQTLLIAAIILPVTLLLGAWLPLLAVRTDYPQAATRLYGANSLGAAAGAALAGIMLLPVMGAAGTVCLAALILFACGMTFCTDHRRVVSMSVLGIACLGALAWPVRELLPVADLLPLTQANTQDIYRHEDALAITHAVERTDGQRMLLTDLQRMDASSDQNAVLSQQNQARLPLLLHPAPHSVLFLGLGTGISVAGSRPFPELSRSAVELSSGAIHAAQTLFVPVNHNLMKQTRIVHDDARHFLRADTGFYDVIIGDLFHPDLAGQSALLSVQQFMRARARLARDGLFVQWLALNQFDPESLAVVMRTFQSVFPQAVLFVDGFRLALVGPRDEFHGATGLLANLERLKPQARQDATGDEGPWTWLGRYWGRIAPKPGPLQDEWSPLIEFRLPHARYEGELNLAALIMQLLATRPDLERAAHELHIAPSAIPAFERAFSASELALRAWLLTLQGQDDAARLMRLAHEANPQDRWISIALAERMLATLPQAVSQGRDERTALQTILAIRPDHLEVLRALWHLERAAGNQAEAEHYRQRMQVASPLDRESRATR